MTARRISRAGRWAAVALLGGTVATLGPAPGVDVLEAQTCDRCSLGLGEDITVQALRVVDADGTVSNARVKDADGVIS